MKVSSSEKIMLMRVEMVYSKLPGKRSAFVQQLFYSTWYSHRTVTGQNTVRVLSGTIYCTEMLWRRTNVTKGFIRQWTWYFIVDYESLPRAPDDCVMPRDGPCTP